MLKVGVVGLGMMGQHHVRVYKELGYDVVGVADANPERAKEIGEKYHIPYYSDYHALIGSVEAISIAVPTSLHRDVALDFIHSGVHCLIEKPIASTLEEAEDIVAATEASQVKVLIGHIERFNPAVLKLKELLDEGSLGKVMQISTRRVGPFQPRVRDVGIIVDIGTHDIDVTRFLTNKEPVEVYAKARRFKHTKEDHANLMLDFGDSIASLEVNWFTPHKVRTLVATGSKGLADLDYIKQELLVHTAGSSEEIEIEKAEPLVNEIRHFVDCIKNDREPMVNVLEGLKVLGIALKAGARVQDV
jgi:UDP-N-acetylglucosamine 3-dehydrogenase